MRKGNDRTILKNTSVTFSSHFLKSLRPPKGRQSTLERGTAVDGLPPSTSRKKKVSRYILTILFMIASVDAGYTKLLRYFNKLDRTPVYTGAVILDVCIKNGPTFSPWEGHELCNQSGIVHSVRAGLSHYKRGLPPRPNLSDRGNSTRYKEFMLR